ncbi:hypothetical protein Poli38472_014250 [Pythium oligandrum]|uniref:Uncharacterized protein n=1 Tax=Pythium oligandrum TaxID=41045 RepID=A0A8K1CKP4_PYTOL|nr:hypothetical protein Poli38472_014250 [Pythium oligandrum]|eukprot:TMW64133.1 hypothetical protein Poli38472_014250 [Pythium oligandrum]
MQLSKRTSSSSENDDELKHSDDPQGEERRFLKRLKGRYQKQRFRKRKREQVEADKVLLQQLEQQHQGLLQNLALAASPSKPEDRLDTVRKYVAITQEIEVLRQGNLVMQEQLTSQDRFLFKLMQYLHEVDAEDMAIESQEQLESHHTATPFEKDVPLKDNSDYEQVVVSSLEHIGRIRQASELKPSTPMEVHGWSIYRKIQATKYEYMYTKSYPRGDLEYLASWTWTNATDEGKVKTLLPATLRMAIVHTVDDDTFVIHKRDRYGSDGKVACMNLVTFRRRTPSGGWIIALQSLPAPDVSPSVERSDLEEGLFSWWLENSAWFVFEPAEVGCTVSFGGHVRETNEQFIQGIVNLMLEFVCRWDLEVTDTRLFPIQST